MTAKKPVPFRNRKHTGWWVASHVERIEYYDEPTKNLSRRCCAWENTVLIRARDRHDAYRKAVIVGRRGDRGEAWNSAGRKSAWRYEGLTMLLPIYEELEHGSEILWQDHVGRTVRSIRAMVKTKRELSVFDDSDDADMKPTRGQCRRRRQK